jgi:hypothetical protein
MSDVHGGGVYDLRPFYVKGVGSFVCPEVHKVNHDATSASLALQHAWNYFELHSKQRMLLFNYFLIASLATVAGLAGCLQIPRLRMAGVGLGAMTVLTSFVFWKLDQRTAFLIKHGEDAITELETSLPLPSRVVYREPSRTAMRESGFVFSRLWTYGAVFRLVFGVMALVGLSGGLLAWWRVFAA